MLPRLLLLLALCFPFVAHAYTPKAEKVVDNVYAIVGPLGQRSADNDGLNANYGFIVTPAGVILVDSGASKLGAEKLETAIRAVTDRPVRWVINTGGQDHRWLGNDHFAARGAELIALSRTAAGQAENAARQLEGMRRFLGDRLDGTMPRPAQRLLEGDRARLELGGETLELTYTHAHYPGDAMIWMPRTRVAFTGDLVYVDRLLGVLPWSSVKHGRKAFQALEALAPERIVPGHGRVCNLAQAKRESGDYYDFLADTIGAAAKDMEPMDATLAKHADEPRFRHLQNYGDLHRANMNRAFLEFEAQ
ncbi:MAG: beta-lactamase domain-containing protein [bacterium]|nr:MAG: beta-lactamase domain-containing protein [bacterium]KAF0147089.1 MAG: beta-lactamase domain-containing protein [bacterium]KAF0164868.1 MAG: beta-lactamase domain-containing protein [bacterium]TXT17685.1 MAG: beta-lactamase domain-containing protein [bacterium]